MPFHLLIGWPYNKLPNQMLLTWYNCGLDDHWAVIHSSHINLFLDLSMKLHNISFKKANYNLALSMLKQKLFQPGDSIRFAMVFANLLKLPVKWKCSVTRYLYIDYDPILEWYLSFNVYLLINGWFAKCISDKSIICHGLLNTFLDTIK